jgi:hypothetical protein
VTLRTCFPKGDLDRASTEVSVKKKRNARIPKMTEEKPTSDTGRLSSVSYETMLVPVREMRREIQTEALYLIIALQSLETNRLAFRSCPPSHSLLISQSLMIGFGMTEDQTPCRESTSKRWI